MGGPADAAGAGPDSAPAVDPDAPWRRGGGAARATSVGVLQRRRPGSSIDAADAPSVSPWSRASIEAPLPTVGEIRERWRAELGLDRPRADGTAGPAGGTMASRARRAAPTGSSTTGDVVLGGLVVCVLLALAAVAVWRLRPDGEARLSATDRLPPAVEAGWSMSTETTVRPGHVAVGAGALVVAADDEVVAYALDDGAELWRRARSSGLDHAVAVHGDTVVVVGWERVGGEIAAFDVATGGLRWEHPRSSTVVYGLTDDAIIAYDGSGDETVARVLDHATGEPLAGGVVPTMTPGNGTRDTVAGTVGDDLALLDLASGEVVTPTIAPFGLRSIAAVADAVVGFTEADDIVLYDQDGRAVDQRPFVSDAFGDFEGRAELFGGVPGTSIGVVASGTSVGFDVAAGRIEPLWELDGRVLSAVSTPGGPVGLARLVDPGTGDVSIGVVDLVDGTVVAITDPDGDREEAATLLDDGYVVSPAIGDPERTITGYGYDGVARWSLELDPGSWYVLGGGVLVVVDVTGDLTVRS